MKAMETHASFKLIICILHGNQLLSALFLAYFIVNNSSFFNHLLSTMFYLKPTVMWLNLSIKYQHHG